MTKSRPADVFLLSSPRTLSNLFLKLLSGQAGWEESTYFVHDAHHYAQHHFDKCDLESPAEMLQEYLGKLRAGYQGMLTARENAHENNHAIFLKSHIIHITSPWQVYSSFKRGVYPPETFVQLETSLSALPRTNPTMLSDEMLLSFVPIFIIRHPALVVDSYYRARAFTGAADLLQSTTPLSTGARLTKALFCWYMAATDARPAAATAPETGPLPGRKAYPIIVDADDILEGDTMQRLASVIGIDPERIPQQWEARSTGGLEPRKKRFVGDLWESTGIDRSKGSKSLDLEAKFNSWNESYGLEVGKLLADLANSHMEDYLWLKSRKF
ncbi:hypothetical protein V2A60_007602 [Cordyceps javanica]|uniref:Uncharacterized protein n=1 Tax=Cordyceps javanica TaxID=43265 RepID=A0A545VAQ3_9HYPO|nr:hypothetical protein IF1G_02769 [Cordyceps javanica]TQW09900.1 sulfotransferase family domain-containing protein [Cordyceps javanica]